MTPNPFLGVFLHWLGGLASGSFVVPYRFVRRWSWETYWLAGGFFSWIIMPWLMASLNTRDLLAVLGETPPETLFYCAVFGMLWGIGNLTFGLSVRYLGVGLGMAMVLGWCAVVGTLAEPWYLGEFTEKLITPLHGNIILAGVAACLAGVFITGLAGRTKELEMPPDQKLGLVVEFNFRKGVLVAAVSGVFSACFAFGLASGNPIKALTMQHGTDTIWQGLPVLVVVLAGGFFTNAFWCIYLNIKNGTGFQDLQQRDPRRVAARRALCRLRRGCAGAARAHRRTRRQDASADGLELRVQRHGRHLVVPAVLLLLDGRNADGRVQVLELDAAHGQHHHLRDAVGRHPQGVARRESQGHAPAPSRGRHAAALHDHRGLRELLGATP